MTDLGREIPVATTTSEIDWAAQHCGVHQASVDVLLRLMPDLQPLIDGFPGDAARFTWDVKVHMLMPRMYPCIPNWHHDFIPREGGVQRPELASDAEIWMWLSSPPLTEFRNGFVRARQWFRFTPKDEHRGTPSGDFCWRGFVRAVNSEFLPPKTGENLRRHSQVYLDAEHYMW
jgi:hypothetical protein